MQPPQINSANLGKWAIDKTLLTDIILHSPDHCTLLEFGSGNGTKELVKFFKVISIEHDSKWVGRVRESFYIHAPIVQINKNGDQWYDISAIDKGLKDKAYQAVLIDGPLGRIGRKGLLQYLDHFQWDGPIFVDDTDRRAEKELANELADCLNKKKIEKTNYTVLL